MPIGNLLKRFGRCPSGQGTMVCALTMLPFTLAAGMTVDLGKAVQTTSIMQSAVDAAALAAAATMKPLKVDPSGPPLKEDEARKYMVQKMLEANLPERLNATIKETKVAILDDEVKVGLRATMTASFTSMIGIKTIDLWVSSAAEAVLDGRACIVALGAGGSGVELNGSAKADLDGCWLYSNKTGSGSIALSGTATAEAEGFCAVGTISTGNNTTMLGKRRQGCYTLDDPMAEWQAPSTSWACTYNNFKKQANTKKTITLSPGVYCGGLQVSGYDYVKLEKGTYFVDGGPLKINSKVELTGSEVGFYLANTVTAVTINGAATVSLSAPTSGAMAGVLIAMQPGASTQLSADITGTASLYLNGTVYLPQANLELAGTSSTVLAPVTQVLAYSVNMKGTSNLRFQSDFEAAGFPILGKFASDVRLTN